MMFSQDILWEKSMGGTHAEYVFDAIATPDYGSILVGGTLSDKSGDIETKTKGDFDFLVLKLDEYGNKEWVNTYGGNGTDYLKSIKKTFDGGYILAGISQSSLSGDKSSENMGQWDIWLIKINMIGKMEWQKTLGGLADDEVNQVIVTQEGGFIVIGNSSSDKYHLENEININNDNNLLHKSEDSHGNSDYWIVKLDRNGGEIWQKTFGGIYAEELKSAVELDDKSIVIGGNSNSEFGNEEKRMGKNDWWLLRLDENGNELWNKSFGTEADDTFSSIILTRDNDLIIAGSFGEEKNQKNVSDFVMLKIDKNANVIWQQAYDIGSNDLLTNVVENSDGTLLISGYSAIDNQKKSRKKIEDGLEDYVIIKTDSDGVEIWKQFIGTKQKDFLTHSIETRDGGYLLMGTSIPSEKNVTNNANFYVVKLLDKEKPQKDKLRIEAMPNPTKEYAAIVIGYEYDFGTCTLIDINGRVLQEFEISLNRTIPLNLKTLPDGFYIVNIKTDKGDDSVKVAKFSE